MLTEPSTEPTATATLRATQVYVMAGICLAMGLALGYFFRGSQMQAAQGAAVVGSPTVAGSVMNGQAASAPIGMGLVAAGTQAQSAIGGRMQSPHGGAMGGHVPSLAEMRQMADQKAAPLLAKLKNDPNNIGLLDQAGATYHATHQFKEAAVYYEKAVQVDPKNVPMRTKLAISLYRGGDVDGAIVQLNRALSYDPKDANSLFDMGMIKLEGRQDSKGALAAWQQLLKSNPQLSVDRRATVEKLVAGVRKTAGDEQAAEGTRSR